MVKNQEPDVEHRILVPTKFPDGDEIDESRLDKIESELSSHFGGLTVEKAQGRWKGYEEPVLEMKAVRDDPTDQQRKHDNKFLRDIAEEVKEQFNQEAVMISRDREKVDFIS